MGHGTVSVNARVFSARGDRRRCRPGRPQSWRWRSRSWWAKQRQELSSCLLLLRHLLNRNGGQFGRGHGSFRERRAVRHKSYSHGDEYNPRPALDRDGFVKPEAREQRHDHVAEGCGREDEGEIGPRELAEITGEEADQERDTDGNPRREHGRDESQGMRKRNSRQAGHAARKAAVAKGS